MGLYELLGAGVVLLATLGVGMIAHELSHVFVLRMFGIAYDVDWYPVNDRGASSRLDIHTAWASVTPQRLPEDVSLWGLRLAALAPFALAIPAVPILAGALPDPLASENVYVTAAAVAWLGIALPSPQDFSLFWYAGRAVEDVGASSFDGESLIESEK